jgi:hypothetical protein
MEDRFEYCERIAPPAPPPKAITLTTYGGGVKPSSRVARDPSRVVSLGRHVQSANCKAPIPGTDPMLTLLGKG